MKLLCITALVLTVVIGCDWSPQRDNTADPRSLFYIPHRRPVIDSVKLVTDCRKDVIQDYFCAFDVNCWITDSDRTARWDSITACIETRTDTLVLGQMDYSPEINGFTIRRTQDQLPEHGLGSYVGDSIRVIVVDVLGAVTYRAIEFHAPLTTPVPLISHPGIPGVDTTVKVYDYLPRLGWYYWGNLDDGHRFSVSVVQNGLSTVWSATGLAPTDTFVVVTDSLLVSGLTVITYSWFLTVTDRRGDRLTSLPGYFLVFPPRLTGTDRRKVFTLK